MLSENVASPLLPPPPIQLEPQKPRKNWHDVCQNEVKSQLDREMKKYPLLSKNVFTYFKPVLPIPQEGPTCGMVALSMGLSLLNRNIHPNQLRETAEKFGWSARGEMCSCDWMKELAQTEGSTAVVLKSGIKNHLGCFVNCLQQGGSILVPYDKDKSMAPYNSGKGNNAHWALVTGIVCLANYSPSANFVKSSVCWLNGRCSADFAACEEIAWKDSRNSNKDEYIVPYVLAFHGKSNRVNLWPLSTLAESNDNLVSIGDKSEWVKQPEGGIASGLRGQVVVLVPNSELNC